MKKTPLVLTAGKTGQLQNGDWVGPRITIAATNPTVTDDSASGYEVFSRWVNTVTEKEYVCVNATIGAAVWKDTVASGGGASLFTDLTDVPSSYSGQALKALRVNSGETGLEFYTPSGGGGITPVEIIYDPDIAVTDGNRYKTWAEVMAAIAAAPVFVWLYIHKPGLLQSATVPIGAYDLSKVQYIRSTPQSLLPTLVFVDGASITALSSATSINGVTISNENTSAPMYVAPAFSILFFEDGAIKNASSATQPAIEVQTGRSLQAVFDCTGTGPLYKDGGGSEPMLVNGTFTIDVKQVPNNSFFILNDLFTSGVALVGTVNIRSYILLPGGYVATHSNFVDGSSEPLPVNVTQLEETRVNELVSAGTASLQVSSGTKTNAANTFAFTGTTPPSGLGSNQYQWKRLASGVFGFSARLAWSTPGVGITKFSCEWDTEFNPVNIPGFSSTDVVKYFYGTVADGANYYPCRVKFLRPNSDSPATMEVEMDTPVDVTYFLCDFLYTFGF